MHIHFESRQLSFFRRFYCWDLISRSDCFVNICENLWYWTITTLSPHICELRAGHSDNLLLGLVAIYAVVSRTGPNQWNNLFFCSSNSCSTSFEEKSSVRVLGLNHPFLTCIDVIAMENETTYLYADIWTMNLVFEGRLSRNRFSSCVCVLVIRSCRKAKVRPVLSSVGHKLLNNLFSIYCIRFQSFKTISRNCCRIEVRGNHVSSRVVCVRVCLHARVCLRADSADSLLSASVYIDRGNHH